MTTIIGIDPAAFDLLVCCPVPLSRSQLLVDFSPSYDRQLHPDPQLEGTIDKVWEQRIAAQPSLFNGTKFRYGGFQEGPVREGGGDPRNIILRLGLTDYKTFIGTNMSTEWERYLVSTTDDADRCRHTANPLGNGAIVETADHHILILQRSMNVGEFPGYVVFPGGHPEPVEAGIKSHLIRQEPTSAKLHDAIAEEMFDAIIREIVEETGVPSSTLNDPVFIGISRRKLNVRPTAFFYVTCSLTFEKVSETYRQAEHSFESTVLFSTSPDALLKAGMKLPGCHHGGAALYQMMREACQKSAQPPPLQ